jgi:hypothetical protein
MMSLLVRIQILVIATCVTCAVALAQGGNQNSTLAGKYEGTAKAPDGVAHLTLELLDEGGKISGQITSPHGVYKIVKGQMAAGVLTLDAEGTNSKGKLTLRQKADVLSGDFTADGKTGPVEFKRAAADEISGDWDGVADAQGQAFPFTLSLKLDGEKVTGSSTSQLGTSNISNGVWKDGKLALTLESGSGNITLVATIVDGKLSGDYDFAGQGSGKWVAEKKKP